MHLGQCIGLRFDEAQDSLLNNEAQDTFSNSRTKKFSNQTPFNQSLPAKPLALKLRTAWENTQHTETFNNNETKRKTVIPAVSLTRAMHVGSPWQQNDCNDSQILLRKTSESKMKFTEMR